MAKRKSKSNVVDKRLSPAVTEMTPQRFYAGMREHFPGLDPADYMDELLVRLGQCKIDVIKLDDHLHAEHGQYEEQGLSMAELVAREYGEPAAEFVHSCL